jgi:hypothetical protein
MAALNPIKELFIAIYAKYNAATDLKAVLTGGLYKEDAPEGTALPYAVFSLGDEGDEDTFDKRHPTYIIQFNIYGNSATPNQVLDIYAELDAVYRDQALTLTNYYHHGTSFESGNPTTDPVDGYKQYTVEYLVELEEK